MISQIYAVSALLLSYSILCLGHGLNNTLLGLRTTIEGYPNIIPGIMMSAFFFGFILGTKLCARLVGKVGYIRVFAAFASVASAISLLHGMFVNEYSWILLRMLYGMCVAGIYMIIEGWLNAFATRKTRGTILAIYMTLNFMCLSLSQSFIFLADPAEYQLFAIVSILISLSLVPLLISKAKQPQSFSTEIISFKEIFKISPLGMVGCLAAGMSIGAFWGLGAVFYTKAGLSSEDVAILMGVTFFGSCVMQGPIGYLSDIFDRRWVIAVTLLMSVIVCWQIAIIFGDGIEEISYVHIALAILFGGSVYTLYSLFISLVNDFITPEQVMKVSGALVALHGVGAIVGPVLAAIAMNILGNSGLFLSMATMNLGILLFAILRILNGRKIPEETSENFVALPKAGAAVIELDPRQDK